jgi:hypothetical protein
MDEEVTEFGYVVISPQRGQTVTEIGPTGQAQQVMYFKIGTQGNWDEARNVYARCNPNCQSKLTSTVLLNYDAIIDDTIDWFQSFQVHWDGQRTGAAGDIFGLDGPKQILQRMFTRTQPDSRQQLYTRVYPGENTEWWKTTDAGAIASLQALQANWWATWALDAAMPALRNGSVTPLVGGDLGTRGPDFTRRFGAVQWFREQVGIPSQAL